MNPELSPTLQALVTRAEEGGLQVEVSTEDSWTSVLITAGGPFPERILVSQHKGYSGRWNHSASLANTPWSQFKEITLRDARRFIAFNRKQS